MTANTFHFVATNGREVELAEQLSWVDLVRQVKSLVQLDYDVVIGDAAGQHIGLEAVLQS